MLHKVVQQCQRSLLLNRIRKLKGVASAAGISALLLGITEPAMFGVNLKLTYPFIGAIIEIGIGSAYIAFISRLKQSH